MRKEGGFLGFLEYALVSRRIKNGFFGYVVSIVAYFVIFVLAALGVVYSFPEVTDRDLICTSGIVEEVFSRDKEERLITKVRIRTSHEESNYSVDMVMPIFRNTKGNAVDFCYVDKRPLPVLGAGGGYFKKHILDVSLGAGREAKFSSVRGTMSENVRDIRATRAFSFPAFIIFSLLIFYPAFKEYRSN